MKLSFFVLFVAISFALSLEKKNQELSRTNGVLLQALRELTTSNEREVGNSQCDHITEDNKSYKCNGYYKTFVKTTMLAQSTIPKSMTRLKRKRNPWAFLEHT